MAESKSETDEIKREGFTYTWRRPFNLIPIAEMLHDCLSENMILCFLAGQAKKDFPQLSWEAMFARWQPAFPATCVHEGETFTDCTLLPRGAGDKRPLLSSGVMSPLSSAEWLAMLFNSGKALSKEHCTIALAYVLGAGILEGDYSAAEATMKQLEEPELLNLLQQLLSFVRRGSADDTFQILNYPRD